MLMHNVDGCMSKWGAFYKMNGHVYFIHSHPFNAFYFSLLFYSMLARYDDKKYYEVELKLMDS